MNAIPATVSLADRDAAEVELARHARSFNSTSLHRIGLHILAYLDPNGPEPRDEPPPAPAADELRLWDRRDGRLGLEGYLEPEHRAAFRSLIEQLAAPHPVADAIPDERTATAQRGCPAGNLRAGPRGPRLPNQRRGTPTPHHHHRLGRPAHQSGHRDAGLRDTYQRIGGPAVGVRRQSNPHCSRREIRDPRRRTSDANRSAVHPQGACRARSRMCVSGLRSATGNMSGAPLPTRDR